MNPGSPVKVLWVKPDLQTLWPLLLRWLDQLLWLCHWWVYKSLLLHLYETSRDVAKWQYLTQWCIFLFTHESSWHVIACLLPFKNFIQQNQHGHCVWKTAHVAWMVVYRFHNTLTVAQRYKKVPLDTNGCNLHHLSSYRDPINFFFFKTLVGLSTLLTSVMVLKHESDKCQSLRTSYWNVWCEKWFCPLSQVLAGSIAT